jgi:hypothetical protein
MGKSWAKPFNTLLIAQRDAWREAKNSAERQGIIEDLAKAIRAQVTDANGEDGVPVHLEKAWDSSACCYFPTLNG